MVLRCSLLGHEYGDADVEREREERGSEVVVIVREYEECTRCGERRVISENTEVTSLVAETTDDSSRDEDETGVDESVDDAEPDDEFDVPVDEHGEPITDDAEILDDEAVEPDRERERGEWPDSDDVGPPVGAESEPAAWPETDDDADVVDDSTTVVDSDDVDSPVGAENEPTSWPETDDDAVFVDADVESDPSAADTAVADHGPAGTETEAGTGTGTGIASAQEAPTPGEGTPPEGVATEFFCPQCSFVAPGDRGSLRAGDICPECRKGYLGERER